jgi:hypothetical protein
MSADFTYQTGPTDSPGQESSSGSAKDRAQQAAGTAADEGKHVAGVARDEAQKVASEAQSQVSHLLGEATRQVEDQSRTQRDRLVESLRSFGDDLDKMAGQGEGGMAADLAREGASRARALSSQLDGREPRELLDDVRGFARRKPGAFLLGALAAGVVAGRLTRGAKDSTSGTGGHQPEFAAASLDSEPAGYGTAAGTPLAGTGVPESTPVYPDGGDVRTGTGSGLPNPAGAVAGDTTWSDTRAPGGLS